MKGHKIQIEKEAYQSLYRQFKEDLVLYSCCTDTIDGYIMTNWGIDTLDAPFIECVHRWDSCNESQSQAKITYFLFVASSTTSINY